MKLFYKIFLLILFIIPFNKVSATTIDINCPNGGVSGEVIQCELTASSEFEISAVSTKLSVSDNLEFVSFETDSGWQGDGLDGSIYLYTYPNKIGNFKLGKVNIRINNDTSNRNGTIYFKDVYFYKADFNKVEGEAVSKNIKVLSKNNNLNSLSLKGYDITPKFDKNTYLYEALVDSDTVVIEASAMDDSAVISGDGEKSLKYGINNFSIFVTNEIGEKKEYKLVITRSEEIKDKEESVDKEQDKEQDKVVEEDNKNTEKDEVLKKDSDSKLKSLVIEGFPIEFNSDSYQYNIEVLNKVVELDIKAIPNSEKSKVIVEGNKDLKIGNNDIIIMVIAEDDSKSVYTITVNKKSDVCLLRNISILNYELDFDCNKYNYELEIGIEDSLNIEVIPVEEESKINIYHNSNLKHEDKIEIVVNLNDNTYKYYIKVLKNDFELGKLFNNKQLVFIGIVLVITPGYLIFRKVKIKHFKFK